MNSPETWTSNSQLNTDRARISPADLTTCDREPVQYPGAIMPHGMLLVLAPDDYRIIGASANVGSWCGRGPEQLAGAFLDRILAVEVRSSIEHGLARLAHARPPRYLGCFRTLCDATRFDVFAHRSGAVCLLEFEAIPADIPHCCLTERFAEVTDSIGAQQSAATWREGMQIAVGELKRLIGCDSVIGVRFLADGSGHAVAEAREPDYPTYLDKRFPRSDVPEPGRRQMVLMPLQYAPELDYEPVPLRLFDPARDPRQIDLGWSMLRSMSRMCSRYYLNMGARSRLLLALVNHGALWGFFSCQSAAPRPVIYSDRLAYQSYAAMAALLLAEKAQAEQQRDALRAKRRIAQAAAVLAATESFADVMRLLPERLLDTLDVSGVALSLDNQLAGAGELPPAAMIKTLVPWLDRQDCVVATAQLPTLFEPAADYPERATGLVAARLAKPGQYLLGFRPEWIDEVRWAGDPRKPVEIDAINGERRLTPRGSFEIWKEAVRGTARPWLPHEIEAMTDLQHAVILAQHAEQQRSLKLLLQQSNADLEAFAFIVSHDLQEPLRGIRNFSQFLRDRTGEQLGPQERAWLDTIMKLGARMGAQIEALLQYARAGQAGLDIQSVDLHRLVRSVLDDLSVRIAETGTRVVITGTLPCLNCDPIRTAAVLENLITNAIKYNDQEVRQVEIGAIDGLAPTLYVRDNGIGIAQQHQHAIFTIFHRLHGRDDYGGGSGAGLTIARKHIERQGGRLWLESAPGQGSTFYFTLGSGPDGSADH